MNLLFIYAVVMILNLLCWHHKKKSKWLKYATLVLIWFILLGNDQIVDYDNYRNNYNDYTNVYYKIREPGYVLLVRIFQSLGLTYEQFRGIILVLCLYFIQKVIHEWSENEHYVYFFYGISTLFIDVVQMRNFMAFSIILYSLLWISRGKKTKGFLLLLLSVSIHVISALFVALILIIVNIGKLKKYKKGAVVLTAVAGALFLNNNILIKVVGLIPFIEQNSIKNYLTTRSQLGFLFPLAMQLINFIIVYLCKVKGKNEVTSKKYFVIYYNLVLINFMLLPLYLINLNFYRYLRSLNLFHLIVCSTIQNGWSKQSSFRLRFNGLVFFYSICWFLFDYVFNDAMTNYLGPLFMT